MMDAKFFVLRVLHEYQQVLGGSSVKRHVIHTYIQKCGGRRKGKRNEEGVS